jgi:hypothetical protein
MGTLNCLLQYSQTPITGVALSHWTTLSFRFGIES